ncbi:LPS assembly lipoprotein LptE [Novosphingobium sp. RD2P27]|uniref:LPS assembly lipoprotein LptE n=2 Tax=Novosphingobium kalidii TaxID=3230299 RepID=A0ABV2D073_9SPHN
MRIVRAGAFRAVVLACSLPLAGCGLQPMYAGGGDGAVARGLSAIQVATIEGRAGWLVRNALLDKLSFPEGSAPRYRLDVRLDDQLEAFGLLRDDTVGRERRTLRARYQLVDLETDAILLDATAGSDAGIDVISSDYATIAAEQTALENLAKDVASQIVTDVALQLRKGAATSP